MFLHQNRLFCNQNTCFFLTAYGFYCISIIIRLGYDSLSVANFSYRSFSNFGFWSIKRQWRAKTFSVLPTYSLVAVVVGFILA